MKRRSGPLRARSGYALILVLALMAVGAFVVLRLSERNDALRRSALGLQDYAQARVQAESALASARYWMSTRALNPWGHADGPRLLREDGRWYRMPDGAWLAVQDHRGLISINALKREQLLQLLLQFGLPLEEAQAWLDVLEDYQDPDSLRRLQGAEKEAYAELGIAGPRNDWLLTLRELEALPRWRERPELVRKLQRLLHTAINSQFNPVTATPAVLRARYPEVSEERWLMFEGLRQSDQLFEGRSASARTGLPLDDENILFAPGFTSRLTVWAPGMPKALDYNLRLTPAGQDGPWIVLEHQSAPRPTPLDEPSRVPVFPLFAEPASAPGAGASHAAP